MEGGNIVISGSPSITNIKDCQKPIALCFTWKAWLLQCECFTVFNSLFCFSWSFNQYRHNIISPHTKKAATDKQ